MKLRNKETGEIREIKKILVDGVFSVKSLAELNEEWEDYEEPKACWFIAYDGGIISFIKREETATDRLMKSIGNYFETEEEAEKAVEKLKAWKRLKDKGFRFCGWATNEGIRGVDFEVPDSFFTEHNHSCISDETNADLDLLFGGEE